MNLDKKTKPTKEFLLAQIEACKLAIQQNQGAMNLCMNMITEGIFMEEEKKDDSKKDLTVQ